MHGIWTGRRAKEASTAYGAPHPEVAVDQIEELAQRLGARGEVDVRLVPAAARVVHGLHEPLELEVGLPRDSHVEMVTRGNPYVRRHTRPALEVGLPQTAHAHVARALGY